MCYHVESLVYHIKTWPHSKKPIKPLQQVHVSSEHCFIVQFLLLLSVFFLVSQSNAFNFDLNVLGQTGDFDCRSGRLGLGEILE